MLELYLLPEVPTSFEVLITTEPHPQARGQGRERPGNYGVAEGAADLDRTLAGAALLAPLAIALSF